MMNVRRWRDILLAFALPLAIHVALLSLSSSWYSVDLSGIPDEGRLPAQFLPSFLFGYRSGGGIGSDPMKLTVWLTSCLAYLLPPAIAAGATRDRRTGVAAALVILGIAGWAVASIPAPPPASEGITYFTVEGVRQARVWLVTLIAIGAIAGRLPRIVTRALQEELRGPGRRDGHPGRDGRRP
jgi:hypothetical protein